MLWPKKNKYKEFDNEKKILRLENSPPPPPHNFSNGPSLTGHYGIPQGCPLNTGFTVSSINKLFSHGITAVTFCSKSL